MERWVAVPGELEIQNEEGPWKFPLDSVLVKTLSLDLRQGDAASRRRVESQILHYDGLDWQTYTYEWLDDQSDAILIEATGKERTFPIEDASAPGGRREQVWRFAGRAECQRCHNKWSGPVLAFQAPQLDRPLEADRSGASQLDAFAQIGLLKNTVPAAKRQRLADPGNPSADGDARARAYLHVNCAHCHRKHAGGAVLSQMPFDVPLKETNMVAVRPTQGTFGIHSAEVVAPREPFRSILLYRMSKLGGGRMPHIGSSEVDRAGVQLIYDWIANLSPSETGPVRDRPVAQLQEQETGRMDRLRTASSTSEQSALVNQLLTTTSGALRMLHAVDRKDLPEQVVSLAVATAIQHQEPAVRDLFERFVPPEQRIKRLGSVVDPDQLLSLTGDVDAGRRVFFETAGVACKNCHRIGQEGKEVGPELTAIGKTLDRAPLLESILQPSKRIDPKYVTYLAETEDGRLLAGLLLEQNPEEVVLKDAQDQIHRIPRGSIVQLVPQQQSLMPELLFRDMTAQQVADLLAFLASLK
jgi:putative heme-binding domain-containing protein